MHEKSFNARNVQNGIVLVLLFWMAVFLTPWTASSQLVSLVGCSELQELLLPGPNLVW